MPETTIDYGAPVSNWLRELLNRPPSEPTSRAVLELFDDCLAGPLPPSSGPASHASLLLVLTTHSRAESANRVLHDLHAGCVGGASVFPSGADVLVLEDRSDEDYALARTSAKASFGARLRWLRSKRHLGKTQFWLLYQAALSVAQSSSPEYVLFIQDDLEFAPSVLSRSLELMTSLERLGRRSRHLAHPCALSLFSAPDDERFGRWIVYPRHAVHGLPMRRTQWFDLPAFLLNRAALELLGYRMVPIHPKRWKASPRLSSGVGRQLTRRLYPRATICQCFPPLVFHGAHSSQMNPEARAVRIMDNRGYGLSTPPKVEDNDCDR